MKAKLILLSGKMGHGKTTAAQYLEDNLSGKIRRKSFAGPLKSIAKLFGLTHEQCWGTLADKQTLTNWKWRDINSAIRQKFFGAAPQDEFLTARQFLQIFGTDVIRNGFCQDAWVKLMHIEIAHEVEIHSRLSVPTNLYFLIDDCRMPNELVNHPTVETIKVRILRPGMPTSSHESETALDGIPEVYYDFIINNDGSMEDYYYKLSKLLDRIG